MTKRRKSFYRAFFPPLSLSEGIRKRIVFFMIEPASLYGHFRIHYGPVILV